MARSEPTPLDDKALDAAAFAFADTVHGSYFRSKNEWYANAERVVRAYLDALDNEVERCRGTKRTRHTTAHRGLGCPVCGYWRQDRSTGRHQIFPDNGPGVAHELVKVAYVPAPDNESYGD